MKRLISVVVLMLSVSVLCTWSGGKQEVSEEKGPETIIYYLWDDPTYKMIVDAFNTSQEEIFVDAKYLPAADYEAKLATLLAGGVSRAHGLFRISFICGDRIRRRLVELDRVAAALSSTLSTDPGSFNKRVEDLFEQNRDLQAEIGEMHRALIPHRAEALLAGGRRVIDPVARQPGRERAELRHPRDGTRHHAPGSSQHPGQCDREVLRVDLR